MPPAKSTPTPTAYMVPAVDRSVRILRLLQRRQQLTVSDVAQASGIGVSSCYAILKTLQHHHLVAFDERAKTYRLGLGLLELGGAVSRDFVFVETARAHLMDFMRTTRLTTFVVARVGHERLMVVDKEEPGGDVRISIAVGTRFRVTEGLSGRCFMAFLPEAECDSLLKSVGLTPFAGLPAPTVRAYRAQLSAAREAGYVALTESPISGANGVAAPVFDSEGRILFALTAMGLSPALASKAIAETGASLRQAADAITKVLGRG
ncbi:IclR family transcriptional regulator [Vineibacter terrae]|uniref:IclR family transcriptional regulator n=1 Tax=Vineibacter terrae TaxID=2586908 RepID=A0A5C8PFA7_9HYPH|nr:IclR family transcriptional regulator [Vineibacter terrae]TXL72337.1 IclR family transcriptional regulator [Vineibacter terrae]